MVVEMEKEVGLKSCPFCGGNADLRAALNSEFGKIFWVKCRNLQCRATQVSVDSEKEAILMWNKRF